MAVQTYMLVAFWIYPTFIPYISSPNLGSFTTLGPRGEASIIRNRLVTSDCGYVIQDKSFVEYDLLECSKQTLSMLEFQLRDARGNLIPLHDCNISFSVVFRQMVK